MSAKHSADGTAQIVFLQDWLDNWLGPGAARTLLPVTDPYTRHHGSLGSFALIYLDDQYIAEVSGALAAVPGVTEVVPRQHACVRFELPANRIGDLVVIARRDQRHRRVRWAPRPQPARPAAALARRAHRAARATDGQPATRAATERSSTPEPGRILDGSQPGRVSDEPGRRAAIMNAAGRPPGR